MQKAIVTAVKNVMIIAKKAKKQKPATAKPAIVQNQVNAATNPAKNTNTTNKFLPSK